MPNDNAHTCACSGPTSEVSVCGGMQTPGDPRTFLRIVSYILSPIHHTCAKQGAEIQLALVYLGFTSANSANC